MTLISGCGMLIIRVCGQSCAPFEHNCPRINLRKVDSDANFASSRFKLIVKTMESSFKIKQNCFKIAFKLRSYNNITYTLTWVCSRFNAVGKFLHSAHNLLPTLVHLCEHLRFIWQLSLNVRCSKDTL